MFTGIIEELGKIKTIKESKDFYEVSILSNFSNKITVGDSIAINGVCLTATYADKSIFNVNIVRETLDKSSLANLKQKDMVNLERAMTIKSRLDGHIVQGHVESVGKITSKDYLDKQTDFTIELSQKYLIFPRVNLHLGMQVVKDVITIKK